MDGYVDANGVHTFYEIAGDARGDPILFLHGGIVSGSDYRGQRDGLSRDYTVILPDRRGHGRSSELTGPISYQLMVDDTIAFMDALGVGRAHVMGHSDGGILSLLIASQHPDRVNRMVAISANTSPGAMAPEMLEGLRGASAEEFAQSANEFMTGDVRPTRSVAFFEKIRQLYLTEPDITADDMARITARTLILGADHDFMTLEDLAFQFRSITDAQLAVVPGAGHELTMTMPDVVNAIILRFLAAE